MIPISAKCDVTFPQNAEKTNYSTMTLTLHIATLTIYINTPTLQTTSSVPTHIVMHIYTNVVAKQLSNYLPSCSRG